jgi:hypothetical protein
MKFSGGVTSHKRRSAPSARCFWCRQSRSCWSDGVVKQLSENCAMALLLSLPKKFWYVRKRAVAAFVPRTTAKKCEGARLQQS